MTEKKVVVIGSGFAGLSAATFMAKAGWQVTVLEKNEGPGGRASRLQENGFTFDMGPSWYWMPDVFERYFGLFGKSVSDYYSLKRLDPSYRIYWPDSVSDIPADLDQLKQLFDSFEPGSGSRLDKFLQEAEFKYKTGIQKLVFKPGLSISEFLDRDIMTGVFRLDVFNSISKHIARYFKHPYLRQLLEFPVLFLGALPKDTPALYSLMNYADIVGGTWYPQGGMYAVVDGMYRLAKELGVIFHFNEPVKSFEFNGNAISSVRTDKDIYHADAVINGADYQYSETNLLPEKFRSYSDQYWEKKLLAPSCLMYYVGLNKKLKNVEHHSLFFDVPFQQHAEEIYESPAWPLNPLFYVSVNSISDSAVAPEGCDNIVFLIPVAAGLTGDTAEIREKYFNIIVERMENRIAESIKDSIVFQKSFSVSDFKQRYHAYRGNAYGLANTLFQTAILKPSCISKKVSNLFYTGQLTVPGPGVPPSLISGEVVASQVLKRC